MFDKPVIAITFAFSWYSEVVGLQIEACFKRNYVFILGDARVVVCGVLYVKKTTVLEWLFWK